MFKKSLVFAGVFIALGLGPVEASRGTSGADSGIEFPERGTLLSYIEDDEGSSTEPQAGDIELLVRPSGADAELSSLEAVAAGISCDKGELVVFGAMSDDGVRRFLQSYEPGEIISIQFLGCVKLTDDIFKAFYSYLPFVTKVSMSQDAHFTLEGLSYFAGGTSTLKSLIFAHYNHINDAVLMEFARKNRALEFLQLSCLGRQVTLAGLEAFAASCPALKKIMLSNVLGSMAFTARETGISFPQVTTLILREHILSDRGLYSIPWRFPGLQELILNDCSAITADGFSTVPGTFDNLTRLTVYDVPDFGLNGLLSVFGNYPKLAYLNLGGRTPIVHQKDLSQFDRFTREVMSGQHKLFVALKELDLSNNLSVTDNVVKLFIAMCPGLEKIGLLGCDSVTKNMSERVKASLRREHGVNSRESNEDPL
jgi:hypothetical protein